MDSNKSIDGLKTKNAKITTGSVSKAKATSRTSTKKPSAKSTKTARSTKATNSTKTTKSAKPAKPTKSTKSSKKSIKIEPTPQVSSAPIEPSTITEITESTEPISPAEPTPQSDPTTPSSDTLQASAEDFLQPTHTFNFDEQTGELKATEESTNPSKKPMKKSKKPISKKRKIITSIILTIVILLIGAIIWLVIWGNDIIAKITGGQGNIFDLITLAEPTYEPLKTDTNGRTNILAFGTSGYNMDGDEGDSTHDGAQLTDSIMVISLNQDTGDIAMLSLPRDLKASPTCTATGKINEVYWCNNMDGTNEQSGAEALMAEVGDILGIDFQYYAHLNWGSLVQIVDILGGITVTLDEGIYDYYYTEAVYEPGVEYTINGEEALGLARARHGTTSGDFSRGASQQKIIIGIKDKIFEKQLALTDIIGLANALGDNLRTNFNVEELKTVAHLASEFDFNSMRQVSLIEPEMLMTTGQINGISYVLPVGGAGYYSRIQDYVAKMFSNNPSVYEDATVLILNGTTTPGLASAEQQSLKEAGFENTSIDDAPAGTYNEQYTIYVLDDTTPATKKLLEEKYSTSAQPYDTLPADIPTNYNFVLILGGSDASNTDN